MLPRSRFTFFITLEIRFGIFPFSFHIFLVRVFELSHSGCYRAADMTFTRHMAESEWSYNKVEWGWGGEIMFNCITL